MDRHDSHHSGKKRSERERGRVKERVDGEVREGEGGRGRRLLRIYKKEVRRERKEKPSKKNIYLIICGGSNLLGSFRLKRD